MLAMTSCEGRSGYYNNDQKEVIAKLTGREWKLTYEHTQPFDPEEFEWESWVYKFNSNGTGSYKWVKWDDGSVIGEPVYFRWTFTTENFAVIYIDKTERFWLIDKLTTTELWVYNSLQDPVIYPNTDNTFYKFTAYEK